MPYRTTRTLVVYRVLVPFPDLFGFVPLLSGKTSHGTNRSSHITFLLSEVGKAGIGAQQWRVMEDSLGLAGHAGTKHLDQSQ